MKWCPAHAIGLAALSLHACSPEALTRHGSVAREIPAAFVVNAGQWDEGVNYTFTSGQTRVALLENASIVYSASRFAMRLDFEGANGNSTVSTGNTFGHKVNYLKGSDRSEWAIDVPAYDELTFNDLYPGIDIGFTEAGGHLKYDVIVEEGADPTDVIIACTGVDNMFIDTDGAIVLQSHHGEVRQPKPETWQVLGSGERAPVECTYRLLDNSRFGFETSAWDRRGTLVIDPGLEYGTYLGGAAGFDKVQFTAFAPDGDMIVVGGTGSMDFPVTLDAFDTEHAGGFPFQEDIFVMRFDPSGTELRYSTFIGGNQNDFIKSIELASDGSILLGGETGSDDYPTTPGAVQREFRSVDAFITRLSAGGNSLVFSTYLGGGSPDFLGGAATLPDGRIVAAGFTFSEDFPVSPDAFDTTPVGEFVGDGFITWLDPNATEILHSTFIGGSAFESMDMMAVAANGDVVVGGTTSSDDFPTTAGASTTPAKTFLARFAPTGEAVFSRYFVEDAFMRDVAIDDSGAIIVLGDTNDNSLPTTTGAFDETFNGSYDAFVIKLDAMAEEQIFSTFIGGGGVETAQQLAVDSAGVITLAGTTRATNFPTTLGAYQVEKPRGLTANVLFVTRLARDGDRLIYSTYVGGNGGELGIAGTGDSVPVALDATGDVLTSGRTNSPFMIVTPDAFDPTYNDLTDAYLARLDMVPTGVEKFGASSPGAHGPLAIGVTAMPQVGSDAFGITCTNASSFNSGFLIATTAGLASPVTAAGIDIWLDLANCIVIPVTSDDLGATEVPLPLPNDATLVGTSAAVQFVWPTGNPRRPFSASNALALSIQP